MARTLKSLGSALVILCALSVMTATAASAQNGMITGTNPFWLEGTDEGEPDSHPITAFGGKIICKEKKYQGGEVGAYPEGDYGALSSGARAFTLKPMYSGCLYGGIFPVIVTMNGCDFEIEVDLTSGVDDTYSTIASLACPESTAMSLELFFSEERLTLGLSPDCVIHIPPFAPLPGASLKDLTNGQLTLGGSIEEVTMIVTQQGWCSSQVVTEEFDFAVTLEGRNGVTGGSGEVPISVSHVE